MPRVSLVSNELPPYRVPLYERLAKIPGLQFQFIFCTEREPNRHWQHDNLGFEPVFLKQRFIKKSGRVIHNNPDVLTALRRFSPSAVITTGFNPTHLYAFAYAQVKRIPHIAMTDGTFQSEYSLGRLHRTVRSIVYARSRAFIHASEGGRKLYDSYGIDLRRCFRSCLCVDNAAFAAGTAEREFDFIFCGRLEAVKNPVFAFKVAVATARKLGRQVSILFVGNGDQDALLRDEAARHAQLVRVEFKGFMPHRDLPSVYRSARLFLFPTLWDPWGVVVNEACASGLPCIVSPNSGAGGELVRSGRNGFVCEFDVDVWAERAALLLTDARKYAEFSRNAERIVNGYNYESAATGVVQACLFSVDRADPSGLRLTEAVESEPRRFS
jgi:glycosyltransferase involved in cell wall biosynthesis